MIGDKASPTDLGRQLPLNISAYTWPYTQPQIDAAFIAYLDAYYGSAVTTVTP